MSTSKKVSDAWSEKVGRKINFELKVVKAYDGREQTQLINPENGAVVVAVNKTGEDAIEVLVNKAGDTFIDGAITDAEVAGPNIANQLDKSDNNVKTPSDRPGPAIEAEKSEDAGELAEDKK